VFEGAGATVTDPMDFPKSIFVLNFTHDGRRNFVVKAFNDAGEELLINKIGAYEGQKAIVGTEGMFFEVQADGNWSIRAEPLGIQPDASDGVEGSGDMITGYFTPQDEGNVPYEFTHDGTRNFIVKIHCGGGSDLVQNTIGEVNGAAVVSIDDGPCFWEVGADGNWSIKPR
jgi:hypothetical protein